MTQATDALNQTLDPQDWDAQRRLAHQMVDDMFAYLQDLRNQPVWRQPTAQAKQALQQPLPQGPQDVAQVHQEFMQHILPYNKGNVHPRFWAWVQGTGTAMGMMAEMLAAGMNPNLGIGDHAPVYVEHQVLAWCKEMLGYPATASGLLVSGGSMANLTALAVARNSADAHVRRGGVAALPKALRLYASTETHNSVGKALELLGLGYEAWVKVPVLPDFTVDVVALEAAIASDRAAGYQPWCIVANAGTVNTGALDDLPQLVALAQREGLWLHVDGAFGALAALLPDYRKHALRLLEQADSVAFDLHKWMGMPYAIGCVLVRDAQQHRAAFATQAAYLLAHEQGIAAGPTPLSQLGIELSRGFMALKAWFMLKEHGIARFAQIIQQNIDQAQYLAVKVVAASELELMAPVPLNVVCFRYRVMKQQDDAYWNEINRQILMRLHTEGVAAPSYTVLNGCYCIRVAHVNHRSTQADFDILVAAVLRIGRELVGA